MAARRSALTIHDPIDGRFFFALVEGLVALDIVIARGLRASWWRRERGAMLATQLAERRGIAQGG